MYDPAYAPLKTVAALARVDPGAVRHWRYRGWLDADGHRHFVRTKGREYHARDVLRAEADTHSNHRSHRERDFSHLAA